MKFLLLLMLSFVISSEWGTSFSVRTPNDETKPLDYELSIKLNDTNGKLRYLLKRDWERELGEKYIDDVANLHLSIIPYIFFGIDYKILESRIKKRIEQSSGKDLRTDDNLEVLNKRINIYKESTLPIVDYYKNKNILCEIDAMESIEAVYDNILKIIE